MGYELYDFKKLRALVLGGKKKFRAQVGKYGAAGQKAGDIVTIRASLSEGSEEELDISLNAKWLTVPEKNALLIDYVTQVGGYRRKSRKNRKNRRKSRKH